MTVTIDGSAGVTTNSGAVYNSIQSGTAVASTSGTSIDFTGIPSWVKRITVMFSGVSTSGTSAKLVQIGAGSVTSSGYLGSATRVSGTTIGATTTYSAGFGVASELAADLINGQITIALLSANTWTFMGVLSASSNTLVFISSSSVALGGTLDRVRITTVNGTDTFDAGTINILYE